MSYCTAISGIRSEDRSLHQHYHDNKYGFPIADDDELFGRLILEINQAGLSWTTILRKEAGFRKAYRGFDIRKIAAFNTKDKERLLSDASIIRNRLKIEAAIANAATVRILQKEHGSFSNWLHAHHPGSLDAWVKLFKKTFRFTGGEIVNEFLVSTGFLPGAHDPSCPIHRKILRAKPPWMQPGK